MTKLMEQVLAAAALLPADEQEIFAANALADIRALAAGDDLPLQPWQEKILRERHEQLQQSPDAVVPLEAVRERLRQLRQPTC